MTNLFLIPITLKKYYDPNSSTINATLESPRRVSDYVVGILMYVSTSLHLTAFSWLASSATKPLEAALSHDEKKSKNKYSSFLTHWIE